MASKVFISWSSEDPRVQRTAEIFQYWFQRVFGNKIEFFYSRDIRPGTRSREEIEKAISDAKFAFFFLSRRTSRASWLVYEAGSLWSVLEKGNAYFLLSDISIEEFRGLCPPFADYQASQINTREDVMRIVETMCSKISGLASESLAIRGIAEGCYQDLSKSLAEITANIRLLPDGYTNLLPYGDNIECSTNFKMPQIFFEFQKKLFLVGINMAFLLDLKSNQENFKRMLDVLMADEKKQVKICIADIWEEHIHYAWDKVILGYSDVTYKGLTEVFQNKDSAVFLDTFIKKYAGDKYEQITRQLTIKTIEMLGDTFWFVDPNEAGGTMMLIPMTSQAGHDRAVFFANRRNHEKLFNGYYSICRAGFDAYGKVLWPVFS